MNTINAILLTTAAGLSTGLGGLAVLFMGGRLKRVMNGLLGFSGGVMLYISLFELLGTADESLALAYGTSGSLFTAAAFTVGMLAVIFIDRVIPDPTDNVGEIVGRTDDSSALTLRTGMLTALAMALHNFPEGIATFVSAVGLPEAAPAIAAAIAMHNIPEGIAVAAPVFLATHSRLKAFTAALLSGIAEPIGALAALTLFAGFMTPAFCALMFAATAGIMTAISLFTLLPACRNDLAVTAGMAVIGVVMAVT